MMMRTKEVSPSDSYFVCVPEEIEEDIDGGVASYWLLRDDLLLQISSYVREQGVQIPAEVRLMERLNGGASQGIERFGITIDGCPDSASATWKDRDGVNWLGVYAVWPWITLFLTVSHPHRDVTLESWALMSIGSLRVREALIYPSRQLP
jgi:hypothetical protein